MQVFLAPKDNAVPVYMTDQVCGVVCIVVEVCCHLTIREGIEEGTRLKSLAWATQEFMDKVPSC